jgi:iron(III) transport system ATP-binding protein
MNRKMNTIIVHCKGVHKAFGLTPAIYGIDLMVVEGEILALLGPSGCGKTTTMRLIAGFERPDAGEVTIGGKVVASSQHFVPPEQRRVGMVFQNYALFPHLTVADNVLYGLRRNKEGYARMKETLELVGLAGLERRFPHELSGGQQQRVALARAIAPQPEILLLDEPFSSLDAGLRDQVRREVVQILRQSNMTAILVTHSQEEALLIGDRVAVMNEGKIEQIGPPEALFLAPATRFVAEFIGSTFFIPGIACAEGLETEIGFLPQPVDAKAVGAVTIAMRVDDLTLLPDEDGTARIIQTIYRGGSYLYEVRLSSGQNVRAESPHTLHYSPGTAVRVELTPGHPLAYFPADR